MSENTIFCHNGNGDASLKTSPQTKANKLGKVVIGSAKGAIICGPVFINRSRGTEIETVGTLSYSQTRKILN